VSYFIICAIVERVVGRGDAAPDAEHPFTPRAQVVITMAVGGAWHAPAINAEHILLGLLREVEGLAAGFLETLGVPLDQVRLRIYRTMINRVAMPESVKSKSNVVACRVDDRDLDATDALVEAGMQPWRRFACCVRKRKRSFSRSPSLEQTLHQNLRNHRALMVEIRKFPPSPVPPDRAALSRIGRRQSTCQAAATRVSSTVFRRNT
jgi:hypothetical protein